ncbi:MAG: hypothetical protein Q7K45_00805 [Nanoarchaeota archaeon]|nr:hypothetical protein [Nanoarchaeota archaeon]
MPGLGLRLVLRPQLQLEQRLEQRLMLVQRMYFSDEELGYAQQYAALEKIKEDLEEGVYDNVPDFSDRVMKRIKIKERTDEVKKVITSLRELVDKYSNPSLDNVKCIVELGLSEAKDMTYAHETFDSLIAVADNIPDSLEQIVNLGKDIRDENFSANEFYQFLTWLAAKTENHTSLAEHYTAINLLMQQHGQNKKVLSRSMEKIQQADVDLTKARCDLFNLLLEQTCELAIPVDSAYENIEIMPLLTLENSNELQTHYSKIPLPILAELITQKISPESMQRMNDFAGTKDMRNSRDNKRAYLSSMITIRKHYEKGVVEDVLRKADSMRQARDIFTKFAGLCRLGSATYDFTLSNGKEIMDHIDRKRKFTNPVLDGLTASAQESFFRMLDRRLPSKYDYLPILKLGEIYQMDNSAGIPLLIKIMENMLSNTFEDFRYNHSIAEKQLACLEGNTTQWRKNVLERRIMGDLKSAEPSLKAAIQTIKEMKQAYAQAYGYEPTIESIKKLGEQKTDLLADISRCQREIKIVPQKTLEEVDSVNEKLRYAYLLCQLNDLTLESLPGIGSTIAHSLVEYSHQNFKNYLEDLVRIANTPEVLDIRKISVRDSDEPNYLFDVGCTPRRTCQRWMDKTGQNDCLPAYVVDANKRLIQAIDERNQVRVRSICRLLEAEELPENPVLFVEEPYADLVSDELYRSILGRVTEKAYAMSKETGKSIAVAVVDTDYKRLLKEMAEKIELDYTEETFTTTFHSRNGKEYSDAFGGGPQGAVVKNGQQCSRNDVGYILITAES